MDNITKTFNKYYNNKIIKPLQHEIVKNLLDNNNILAILPTGYGKSVCYQLVYLMDRTKYVIVISPLISLIKDQSDKLIEMNIPVECYHSEVKDIFQSNHSEGKIIFLTPEYFNKSKILINNLKSKLSLVAIDEAHCISTWGHEFRPEYLELKNIKEWIGNIPLIALTATATKKVEDDIIKYLAVNDIKIFKTSFDRTNLYLEINRKPNKINDIFTILDKYINDSVIIYCRTRKDTENIDKLLKENNYKSSLYHSKLKATEKIKIHEDFSNKIINIIVATTAFGMGIDQNIHLIIHWGCPSDMESYYQEIGRAGRDNLDAECILYYEKKDYKINRLLIKDIDNIEHKRFKDEQISFMERFCITLNCRRKIILEYFGENLSQNYLCNKCDYCLNKIISNTNISNNILYPLFIIIHTIYLIKYNIGIKKLSLILKGSKLNIINNFIYLPTYGILKSLNEDQIKNLINILIINEYLKENDTKLGYGSIIELTIKAYNWYNKFPKQLNDLSYENLYILLNNNKININIPDFYKNIKNIKFNSLLDDI